MSSMHARDELGGPGGSAPQGSAEAAEPASSRAPAGTGPATAPGYANGHGGGSRGGRRGWIAAGLVLVVAAAVGGAAAAGLFSSSSPGNGSANSGYATSTRAVTRQSLTSQTEEDATLGDAGTWTVTVPQSSSSGSSGSSGSGSSSSGTITWLPQVGWTVKQGQAIYKVSSLPVVLLYGNVPAYRALSEGLTGPDVTELNTDLVKLGYLKASSLGPRSGWDYYSAETAYGVEQFQLHYGMTETGSLSLGQAAFLPGQALITAYGTGVSVGGAATPGAAVLTASSTTPVVSIQLDPGLQGTVKVGDSVSVTLPSGDITPGVISQVQRVATSSSSSNSSDQNGNQGGSNGSSSGTATITVLATLTHPKAAGDLNQAPVTVTITTGSVRNAIVVPVNALLAEPGGKYAVEVASGSQHHLVDVVPGLFDDAAGLVQVTGNLTPGQLVVVPGI